MSAEINFGALTLNSEEARSVAECVMEQTYSRPEIAEVKGIQTGVDMDKYIPILGQHGLVGKLDPGGCSVNAETGVIGVTQKQWTPKLISFRLTHCQEDVPTLLKFWKKTRTNPQNWEQVDNEMMAFITERVTDAVVQSVLRFSDFGDPTENTVALGGHLTNGTTKEYFTALKGLWPQIFTDQAGAKLTYRHEITENSGVDDNAQLTLAADAALQAFRKMYENIDPRAFNTPLVFQVSRSLFNNWQTYMEDKSLVFQLDRTEMGSTKFSYRGIPIVVRNDWDRIVRSYFYNGTTYYLPHRAILTDINNVPIGTVNENAITNLDSFYDRTDKKHYIDAAYSLDSKLLLEYALASAY